MRWLITGFGPFLDVAENPAEHVARAVAASLPGAHLLAPLAVRFGAAAGEVLERARVVEADAIVSIGVASSATSVRVERWGRNRSSTDAPDVAGTRHAGRAVRRGGPPTLATPLDVDAIVAALVRSGVRAIATDDAGGFVCNDLYYRLLDAGTAAVFVHVPPDARGDAALGPALAGALAAARLGGPVAGALASACVDGPVPAGHPIRTGT